MTSPSRTSEERQNTKLTTKKARKRVYRTLMAGYLIDHNHARDWARRLCAQRGKPPIPDRPSFDLNIMTAIEDAVQEAGGTFAYPVEQEDGRMACFVTTQHKTDWFRILNNRVIITPKHQMVEGESEEICREFLEKNGIPFGKFEMRFADVPLEEDEFW
ncbi:hypothetical protein VNI00_012087 [Paramarasmius palmivorus]|uniref:Uncharacterized protein n=1 Tax=Paramarasmius palmivorus TaxID=297713 RepID=A0AAW0C7G1_9AGAR